jgi:predicted hydrolase (HD superfamily)
MNRIEKLREHINSELLAIADLENRRIAYQHLYTVSVFAAMIAVKRGENPELATMAGMLHDFYSFMKMDSKDHGHKGAVFSKEVLERLAITNNEETQKISNAIYHHCDKGTVGYPFDEVLKDADVLAHCLHDITEAPVSWEVKRFEKLKKEFGFGAVNTLC